MLQSIFDTFFPRICAGCDRVLLEKERVLCTRCLHRLPLIEKLEVGEELIKNHFYGRLSVPHAASLLFYHKKGLSQHVIHQLKYHGNRKVSRFLGKWLSGRLQNASWPRDIEVVIPVPLHKNRKRQRGYNQVSGFGRALAKAFDCRYSENILMKTFNSPTQVFKNRFSRTELKTAFFALKKPKLIKGRNILLVDDLITTGSTLEACMQALLPGKPARINLATMAITQ